MAAQAFMLGEGHKGLREAVDAENLKLPCQKSRSEWALNKRKKLPLCHQNKLEI